MDTIHYKVEGLDCAEEVAILNKVVGSVRGVKELKFNILKAKMSVTYDPRLIDSGEIVLLVRSTGMRASLWKERLHEETVLGWHKKYGRLILTICSGLFLFLGLLSHYWAHPNLLDLIGAYSQEHQLPFWTKLFYLAAIFCGIWYVVPKAYVSLRHIRPDINLLMVIAIVGAIGIQQWFEGASVSFLFALALLLEQWSVGRARRSIASLMELSPPLARTVDPKTGEFEEKKVEEVQVGSTLYIRPGEKIPLDGVVTKGSSSVNQAPITGESLPISKEVGDEVYAGTLNEDGFLECRTTKPAQETTLAHIIQLVDEARAKSALSELWVETFAKYYTPTMLLFSLIIMIIPPLFFSGEWFDWVYRGLVLLVIACPCALVISVPVSFVCGLTVAARNGVLIKGGIYLEEVGKLKALALDKTGTLTYGRPKVQSIVPLNEHTKEELLERAVALERPSEHPLSRAVLNKGEEMGIQAESVSHFQVLKGKGALAQYRGKLYWIGSHRLMHEMGEETDEVHQKALDLEDAGHSILAIGTEDHVCGLISFADTPREWIRETIEGIKGVGIQEVVMLTGDNEATAHALALHTGVDAYQSELLPEEKVESILALKKKWDKVGMVGDGINDAPAMAAANIGFAMGAMGTDTAIETADITFMSDELSKLPWLIRHSRKVLKIVKQNISFSLIVKAIFIILALLNRATLWMAIAADTGATLLVIFNALRLLK
ncbi:MAG: heavy metal translocating P-type ATPase [Chlamydiales bacterium]